MRLSTEVETLVRKVFSHLCLNGRRNVSERSRVTEPCHQPLSLLARPQLCRCTDLGALPQSSGQPALVLLYRHGLISFGRSSPFPGLSVTAARDLVNDVHLWNLNSLLLHLQARFDRCCRQSRSLLRGSDDSELRLVLTSHVLHGGMRDLVLHCMAIKLLIWTVVDGAASGCFCRVLIAR